MTGCCANTAPLCAEDDGCVVIERCVAGAAVTVKLFDVAGVRPVDANTSVCAPDPTMLRSENVATPLTAVTVMVPLNVPLPLAIATVTAAEDVVAR